MPQQRESFRTIRVSDREDRTIAAAARLDGVSVSEVVRAGALREAERRLGQARQELAELAEPEPAAG